MNWIAIAVGATLGAWLRYALGLALNAIQPALPFGTVAANLGGGFMIGIAVAFFGSNPALSPAWRLLVITGFLGGLTTFSTFSAESMSLLQSGEFAWALGHTALHVIGSIGFCFVGYAFYKAIAT
ncbi:MAG TPA: fluoride efflux transporter CrcB [Burkholderiaceae bacterium]|jgi:CrcB protein|nr:fluoride efflux transporter CrcB [Burkholderiaceae bacterium]